MIWELVVTSAPRGLKPGRSGFQVVLQTRGIHPALAESLEKASGYSHVYPVGDPRNPQIRSHVVRQGAWGSAHVVSRIVDAGNGYDGRSNKLAHHVAFDAVEVQNRARSSPAAVLLQLERSGAFPGAWRDEPHEQPAGPFVPVVASEPGPCPVWTRAAGDAGWAGFVADRAVAKQPTWIIAPPGVDLVELYAEALALVNYPQRWGITFTTYASDAGDALWLGTVDGSPQAQAARGQSRIAVVDLVRRPPLTLQSPLIAAARGAGAVPWKREAPTAPVAPAGTSGTSPLGSTAMGSAGTAGGTATTAGGEQPAANGTRPPPVGGTRPPPIGAAVGPQGVVPAPPDGVQVDGFDGGPRRSGGQWVVPTLVVGVLAIVGLVVGFVPPVREAAMRLLGANAASGRDEKPAPKDGDVGRIAAADTDEKPEPDLFPTDYAGQAEREAAAAKRSVAAIASLDKEMNDLATRIDTGVKDFAERAKQAAAAIAAGRSPGTDLEQAASRRKELKDLLAKVAPIRAQVDEEVAAAVKAAKAAGEIARQAAEDKACSTSVSTKARAAAAAAEACRGEAVKNQETFDQFDQQVAEFQKAFEAADADFANANARIAELRNAFAGLQKQLQDAQHFPEQGLDGLNPKEQTVMLCEVGAARIDLELPHEKLDKTIDVCALQCQPVKDKPETWKLVVMTQGPAEIGMARVTKDRKLAVTVFADVAEQPMEHRPRARAALACSVLRIRNAIDGSGTPPPGSTTYVQLAMPILEGPLVFPKFFEGDKNETVYPRPALKTKEFSHGLPDALPPEWPVVVDFQGVCGELMGGMAPDRTVDKNVVKGTGGMDVGSPRTWSMRWTWKADGKKDEPIVTTDFALGQTGVTSGPVIKVVAGALEPGWDSRDTLVRLTAKKQEKKQAFEFGGFFTPKTFEAETRKVHPTTLQQLINELVGELMEGRQDQKPASLLRKLVDPKGPAQSLEEWREWLRLGLARTEGYVKWVAAKHPDPGAKPGEKAKPHEKEEWERKSKEHAAAAKADEKYAAAYWEGLQGRIKDPACQELDAALMCRLRDRLEEIRKGKAKVATLLTETMGLDLEKGKGELPKAMITGEIVFEFKSLDGCRAVFMSFREGQDTKAEAKSRGTDVDSSPGTSGTTPPVDTSGAPAQQ